MSLQPFFSYFGGKWRLAPRYPAPRHDTIIEPFAGSAGYATRYHHKRVILVEKDPHIAALWRWLIGASARDVLALPEDPDQAKGDARALVWFNQNRAARYLDHRREVPNGGFHGAESWSWNRTRRARIASQVDKIRHWQIIEGEYTEAPDVEADWFIDPPYVNMEAEYAQGRAGIDFGELGSWCRSRRGQVIVCENEGASWLPFRPFREGYTMNNGFSREAIWTNDAEAQATA